tara:strand:- start:1126 stop:1227 length:102 start_codon:yes stop_codon:yes gene_type:complete
MNKKITTLTPSILSLVQYVIGDVRRIFPEAPFF